MFGTTQRARRTRCSGTTHARSARRAKRTRCSGTTHLEGDAPIPRPGLRRTPERRFQRRDERRVVGVRRRVARKVQFHAVVHLPRPKLARPRLEDEEVASGLRLFEERVRRAERRVAAEVHFRGGRQPPEAVDARSPRLEERRLGQVKLRRDFLQPLVVGSAPEDDGRGVAAERALRKRVRDDVRRDGRVRGAPAVGSVERGRDAARPRTGRGGAAGAGRCASEDGSRRCRGGRTRIVRGPVAAAPRGRDVRNDDRGS